MLKTNHAKKKKTDAAFNSGTVEGCLQYYFPKQCCGVLRLQKKAICFGRARGLVFHASHHVYAFCPPCVRHAVTTCPVNVRQAAMSAFVHSWSAPCQIFVPGQAVSSVSVLCPLCPLVSLDLIRLPHLWLLYAAVGCCGGMAGGLNTPVPTRQHRFL